MVEQSETPSSLGEDFLHLSFTQMPLWLCVLAIPLWPLWSDFCLCLSLSPVRLSPLAILPSVSSANPPISIKIVRDWHKIDVSTTRVFAKWGKWSVLCL